MDKKALRASIAAARRELSAEQRETMGAAVSRRLTECPAVREARVILSYTAFDGETDLREFHRWCEKEGKTLAFPVSYPGGRMEAFVPADSSAWVTGRYGIAAPDEERSRRLEPEELELVIVPCVGFDSGGMRMGRGGGYYDRYLPRCPRAVRIAAAYELQKLCPVPEVQPWDAVMDAVATERRWYRGQRDGNGGV